jgi:hypothetical protein
VAIFIGSGSNDNQIIDLYEEAALQYPKAIAPKLLQLHHLQGIILISSNYK